MIEVRGRYVYRNCKCFFYPVACSQRLSASSLHKSNVPETANLYFDPRSGSSAVPFLPADAIPALTQV